MMSAPHDELEACNSLFMRELGEPGTNRLRVVVAEGVVGKGDVTIRIGEAELSGLSAVGVTELSRHFELVWSSYVAYCVVNESFDKVSDNIGVRESGRLLQRYSRSHFLSYVRNDTLAETLSSGLLLHYCLVCQDHLLHVVSSVAPQVTRISPA